MLTQELAIEKVKSFVRELIENGVHIERIYLYGSYSKNCQTKDSDIDLALVSGEFTGFGFEDRKLLSSVGIKKDYLDIETKTFSTESFTNGNPFYEEIIATGIEIVVN
ncbi:MAG: nucleotidyltransferase domain-containing protein [Candidatus Kapabacteria bacterium]|nr:nucleotidyltransferase domain-containing protein [Candidatus Kapabacteria bacterium]